MARKAPASRLDDILEAAARVFIQQGYRRTQMADVADALGLAKGTLYLYVESKEALFDAVVRRHGAGCPPLQPDRLPIPTPPPGATAAYLRGRLAEHGAMPKLEAALLRERPRKVSEELLGIVREIYTTMSEHRTGLKLLERCAADHPELARIWFHGQREAVAHGLLRYLELRRRHLRPGLDAGVAASALLEQLLFWAVHRHFDPAPRAIDEARVEDTVVRMLLGAVLRDAP